MAAAPITVSTLLRPAPDVSLRRRADDGAVLLERDGRFLQLSPRAVVVWKLCDGRRDLAGIQRAFRERVGTIGNEQLIDVARALIDGGFAVAEACIAGTSEAKPFRSRHLRLTFSPEALIAACYRFARPLLSAPGCLACGAIAIVGAIVFIHAAPAIALPGVLPKLAFAFGVILSVVAHEAGHALVLHHFGGRVRRAGVGWYWFAPIAFVDTSDAHALTKRRRLAVSLAGIGASAVAGAVAILASHATTGFASVVLGSTAAFNYLAIAWNLNPLLELDGYHILTDVLNRPNLRADGLRALRRGRGDAVSLIYAVGAIAFTVAFLLIACAPLVRAGTIGTTAAGERGTLTISR